MHKTTEEFDEKKLKSAKEYLEVVFAEADEKFKDDEKIRNHVKETMLMSVDYTFPELNLKEDSRFGQMLIEAIKKFKDDTEVNSNPAPV